MAAGAARPGRVYNLPASAGCYAYLPQWPASAAQVAAESLRGLARCPAGPLPQWPERGSTLGPAPVPESPGRLPSRLGHDAPLPGRAAALAASHAPLAWHSQTLVMILNDSEARAGPGRTGVCWHWPSATNAGSPGHWQDPSSSLS